jgi:hypothetical protein
MSYTIIEGTTVRFLTTTPFTSITGVVVNPDVVTFSYEVQGQNSVTYTWTNPTGDTTGTINNNGTGYFYADIPTNNLPGVWTWRWASHTSTGIDTTATEVAVEGSITVSPTSVT